jgi:hypothetical protein
VAAWLGEGESEEGPSAEETKGKSTVTKVDEAKSNPFPFNYKTKSACLEYENHLRKLHDLALDDAIWKGFPFELSFVSPPSTCLDTRVLSGRINGW